MIKLYLGDDKVNGSLYAQITPKFERPYGFHAIEFFGSGGSKSEHLFTDDELMQLAATLVRIVHGDPQAKEQQSQTTQ